MSKKARLSLGLLLAAVFLTGVMAGIPARTTVEGAEAREPYEYLKTYAEVLDIVKEQYVDGVSDKDLVYASIKGMLSSLDPHSSFLTPEEYREQETELAGEFGGIGIELTVKDGFPAAMQVLEGTPAFRAGLKPGDEIVEVDGKATRNMSPDDVLKHIRGRKGKPVTLTIMRKGFRRPKKFQIVRSSIKIKSVTFKLLDDAYGYIRIAEFQEQTGKDMEAAVKELQKSAQGSLQGILLDLRDNPGGLLDQAADVADRFIADGLITYTEGRKEDQKLRFYAHADHDYLGPLVVLVNEGSASASEIVAGALQDTRRALIVGTRTFGKGSVQTIFPLADGSALRLTTSRYYTPMDRSIQADGIHPDIVVNSDVTGRKGRSFTHTREEDLERHLQGAGEPGAKTSPGNIRKDQDLVRDQTVEGDFQLAIGLSVLKSLGTPMGVSNGDYSFPER
ncbi:MAG TPA: S41 family peptidase [Syntrophorhabdales bacterium]|nr:S41 family peptidase [Syntrophorhabdales bacterium]